MGVVSSLGLTCTIDMVELVVDDERDSGTSVLCSKPVVSVRLCFSSNASYCCCLLTEQDTAEHYKQDI